MYIFKQYYSVRQYFIVCRFVSERKRQVLIEQTRFLSTVFLCSEFKLENIYSGVNFYGTFFAVIYIWGNLFFYPGYQRFFSRAAEIFARVTIKTWQKPETALEKSLAPGVLFFRIAEKKQKLLKLEPAKISCHTVFRSTYIPCKLTFFFAGWNIFYYLWRKRVGITLQEIVESLYENEALIRYNSDKRPDLGTVT